MSHTPVVHCTGVIKDYRGLRPLRLLDLVVQPGERVVLSGIDVVGAEVLTNLVNGFALPDQGEVSVFGRPTSAITDADAWLASLDPFGVITARAILLDAYTVRDNVALSLTALVDPVDEALVPKVDAIAREAGLDEAWFARPLHEAPAPVRMRVHLARAIALDPALLLMEHPTAALEAPDRAAFAADVARVSAERGLTVLAVSQDREFARRVATRHLQLHPGTGALTPLALA